MRQAVLDAIVAHAREAAPAECCGVLLGSADHISEAVRARNLSTDPNRFLIDPQDHIGARRTARSRSLDVVGFYHSHPHSPPVPSATDRAEMGYPDLVHLIVSLEAGPPETRAFTMSGDNVQGVVLTVEHSYLSPSPG